MRCVSGGGPPPPPRCRKADVKVHLSQLRESGFDVPPHLEIKLLGRRLLSLVQQVVSGSDSATAELPIALTPFAKIDGSDNEESGLEGGPSIVSCPAPFDPHAPTMSAMPCYLSEKVQPRAAGRRMWCHRQHNR